MGVHSQIPLLSSPFSFQGFVDVGEGVDGVDVDGCRRWSLLVVKVFGGKAS